MKFSLRVIALTVCICMMSALFPIYALAASEPSEWARAEVDLATSAGLVPRRITDDYKADITREEFCEIVVNLYFALSQKQAPAVKTKFTDTDNRSVAIA